MYLLLHCIQRHKCYLLVAMSDVFLFEEISENSQEIVCKIQKKMYGYANTIKTKRKLNLGGFKVGFENVVLLHQMLFLLKHLLTLYTSNSMVTTRDVYYMNTKLFKSTVTISNLLKKIAIWLKIQVSELPIQPSLKGKCFGMGIFHLDTGQQVDCSTTSHLIPYSQNITMFKPTSKVLLIVEKDAVFQSLMESCLKGDLNNIFIITGKGFPDNNTKQFVKNYGSLFDTVHVLVDMDPHGLCIYNIYAKLVGQITFHLIDPPITNIPYIPLKPKDNKMLLNLLETRISFTAQKLLMMQFKYEIEQMDMSTILEYLRLYTCLENDMLSYSSACSNDLINDL